MNQNEEKDKEAVRLIGDYLRHHKTETNVGSAVAVSGGRLMYFRIVRKPPKWMRLLLEIRDWIRGV